MIRHRFLFGLGLVLTVGCGDEQHPPVFDAEVIDQSEIAPDVTRSDAATTDAPDGHDGAALDVAIPSDASITRDVTIVGDQPLGPDVTTVADATPAGDASRGDDAHVDAGADDGSAVDVSTVRDAPIVTDGSNVMDALGFDVTTEIDATATDRPDAADASDVQDGSTADLTPADAWTAADADVADVASADGGASDIGVSSETVYRLAPGQCFTFATATAAASMGRSCGDLLALAGANVDLSSSDFPTGPGGLCLLAGTYRSLAEVPSSYAGCAWTGYVEGFEGLANRGMIVRDVARVHHYRVHIVSNALPALVFVFARID